MTEAPSLTFDGDNAQEKACKVFNANFEVNDVLFNPTIKHPVSGETIYLFFASCHMLKFIRNYFGSLKTFIYEGEKNEWRYLEILHQLQTDNRLHYANKLKKKNHIIYDNEKMKVYLAAQLFSRSVADAIHICRNGSENPEDDIKENVEKKFKDSEATEQFIRNMNEAFDFLNSSNPDNMCPARNAISLQNISKVKDNIERLISYFKKIQFETEDIRVVKSEKRIKEESGIEAKLNPKTDEWTYKKKLWDEII